MQREGGERRDQRVSALLRHGRKGALQVLGIAHLHGLQLKGQRVSRRLDLLPVERGGLGVSERIERKATRETQAPPP